MAKKDRDRGVYLGQTLDVSGDPIQSYLDAKTAQRNIRTNWDTIGDIADEAMIGVQSQIADKKQQEEEKRKELESYESTFEKNVNKITENAGSLGEEYFSIATQEAQGMQEEYMEAVRNGDKETQSKLKMKLQGLSTSVQSLKESLTITAELSNDNALSNGRTEEEKLISSVCTDPNNIVYTDGEWKWKNPKYDGSEGSKEFFTQEDFDKSLVQNDKVTSKAYLDWEFGQNAAGMGYVNGDQGAGPFDFSRTKTSIGDQFITQDNIMSVMHDDFRGQSSTFAAHLGGYLDSMPDLYQGLGIDVNGDGFVNEGDWDSEEDKKIIVDAITNKSSQYYNYDVSRDIVSDYLARQAETKFYGTHPSGLSVTERKALRPEPGDTPTSFIAKGGIMGALANEGTVWNDETKSWENIAFGDEEAFEEWKKSKK